ncbi:MAG: WHG domain-containing protein [Actinomyces sp.]|nr:WHG domain-containing protein [Actinomyces sp.]MDN6428453.1 WHG domain-containing protein [Propionibacterium sp.]MDN6794400.1 WHG domain-containing protein [Propionibacterium sp.]
MAERLNRDEVVRRAGGLADRIGLSEVTITRLGRELGIAPQGVYRHVEDVRDLRGALARLAAGELSVELSRASSGLSGRPALVAVCTTLRSWAARHPGRYAALQVAPDPEDPVASAATEELVSVIASALCAYSLTGDDLVDAIRMVRSTVHGFVDLETHGGFRLARDLDTTFERVIDSLDLVLGEWS